jgi:hypothetical protein
LTGVAARNPDLTRFWRDNPEAASRYVAEEIVDWYGDVQAAAESLRIERRTLYRWIHDPPGGPRQALLLALLRGRHLAREERKRRGMMRERGKG